VRRDLFERHRASRNGGLSELEKERKWNRLKSSKRDHRSSADPDRCGRSTDHGDKWRLLPLFGCAI
jgi:hypothetical protein